MAKLPAMHIYPGDWLRDRIADCSLAAQGLWFRMMMIMHDSERYGYLQQDGKPIPPATIARKCGCELEAYIALLLELDNAKIPRRTRTGVIYSEALVLLANKRQLDANRQTRKRRKERDNLSESLERNHARITHNITRESRAYSTSFSDLDPTSHSVTTEEIGSSPASDPPPRGESELGLPPGYPPLTSSPVGQLERAWHRAQRHRAPKHSLLTAPDCAFLDEAIAALGFEFCRDDLAEVLAGDVSSFGFVRKRWARKMAQSAAGGAFHAQPRPGPGVNHAGPPELVFNVHDIDDVAPIPASWRKEGGNG